MKKNFIYVNKKITLGEIITYYDINLCFILILLYNLFTNYVKYINIKDIIRNDTYYKNIIRNDILKILLEKLYFSRNILIIGLICNLILIYIYRLTFCKRIYYIFRNYFNDNELNKNPNENELNKNLNENKLNKNELNKNERSNIVAIINLIIFNLPIIYKPIIFTLYNYNLIKYGLDENIFIENAFKENKYTYIDIKLSSIISYYFFFEYVFIVVLLMFILTIIVKSIFNYYDKFIKNVKFEYNEKQFIDIERCE